VVAGGPRVDGENAVIALGARGVRSSVVRLPPTVHSSLDHHGFVPMFIAAARKNGFSAYVGDGANVWPAVHTLDAARLYRLALESAPAGARLHGVADEGVAFRAVAEAIGTGLGLPAKSVSAEEAPSYLGAMAHFAQVHNPTSSARTRALLSWEPTHAGLLVDLAERHYFVSAP
jgi:nucleoside-diphosphate-sugar epimerase